MIYKTLKKVSNVCQLLDKRKYASSTTINEITFTNNGDGTITANGTATQDTLFHIFTAPYTKNHIILLIGCPSGGSSKTYCINTSYGNDYGNGIIKKNDRDITIGSIYIRIYANITVSNLVFKPQLFDLTEMYGAGNEPTTVEEFRQDFPEEMYDYSPYCFVKSYKNCLKVNDYCQLLDKSKFPATPGNGVTFTNNGDGSITVNGTATNEIYRSIESFGDSLYLSHKYLLTGENSGLYLFMENRDKDNKILAQLVYNQIGSLPSKTKRSTYVCYIKNGVVCDNLVLKPQLFDLTEMYGAGNEPTTVDQFKADFPDELYDYKPYSIVPSYKKSLMCKTKNLFYNNQVYNIKGSLDEIIWRGEISAQCYFSWYQSLNSLKNPSAALFTFNYSDGSVSYAVAKNELISRGRVHINSSVSKKLTSIVLCNWCYANGSIYNLQLELGGKPTDYVPYGHL